MILKAFLATVFEKSKNLPSNKHPKNDYGRSISNLSILQDCNYNIISFSLHIEQYFNRIGRSRTYLL